ncbi:MAG: TorF family putative porin [Pseudomonadota bacterium]
MKNKLLNSLMLVALAAPGVALAEDAEMTKHKEGTHVIPESAHTLSANIGFTSDYIFRGISQTSGNPAIQGGFDYGHSSGFYAGVWGSNISWISDFTPAISSSLEIDTYLGFSNDFADGFNYDVGFVRYNYPASNYPAAFTKPDTDEIYGAVSYQWITAKYSYGLGDFLGVARARGTSYIELNASVPLGDSGVTLDGHVGRQTYKGTGADALVLAGTPPTYSDYKLSVSKDIGDFSVSLAYSDTNSAGGFYTTPVASGSRDLSRSATTLSVSRSF